jgi:hypothetical protein
VSSLHVSVHSFVLLSKVGWVITFRKNRIIGIHAIKWAAVATPVAVAPDELITEKERRQWCIENRDLPSPVGMVGESERISVCLEDIDNID